MSFTATSFIFDGIPSESYGLMIANIGENKQVDVPFAKANIVEDRPARMSTPIHYGVVYNDPLEFQLPFCVCNSSMDFDRFDIGAIAGWLTGHHDYKWLHICQWDMENIGYKCIITELKPITIGGRTIGFNATIRCDGPYAYYIAQNTRIECSGSTDFLYRSYSNVNHYYLPKITISGLHSGIAIRNNNDDGYTFELNDLPASITDVEVDCLKQIMTHNGKEILYDRKYWNGNFPRFVRGDNRLTIAGKCTIEIQNQFLWNIGA